MLRLLLPWVSMINNEDLHINGSSSLWCFITEHWWIPQAIQFPVVVGVTVVVPSLQLNKAGLYSGWDESGLFYQRSILQMENPLGRSGQSLSIIGIFGLGLGFILGSDYHF